MTDQQIRLYFGELNASEMRLARAIGGWHERQIEELKDEAAKWKANHDNQVKLKSLLISRPDLGERAPRIQKILDENAKLVQDWADTDTAVREACRKAGLDVEGSPAHVPDIAELVERLAEQHARLRAAADGLAEALEAASSSLEGWHGLYERQVDMNDRALVTNAEAALAVYQAAKP